MFNYANKFHSGTASFVQNKRTFSVKSASRAEFKAALRMIAMFVKVEQIKLLALTDHVKAAGVAVKTHIFGCNLHIIV